MYGDVDSFYDYTFNTVFSELRAKVTFFYCNQREMSYLCAINVKIVQKNNNTRFLTLTIYNARTDFAYGKYKIS